MYSTQSVPLGNEKMKPNNVNKCQLSLIKKTSTSALNDRQHWINEINFQGEKKREANDKDQEAL